MTEQENKLAVLEQVDKLLAEIKTIDDARHMMARAEAARAYAKEAKMGFVVQNTAAEVKIRTIREGGRVLTEMQNRGELAKREDGINQWVAGESRPLTLKDLDLTSSDADAWFSIYRLSPHVFEKGIDEFWANEQELTTWGFYRWGKSYGKAPAQEKRQLTNATAFKDIQQAITLIRDRIQFIKSSTNNGGGKEAKYYLRSVIHTLTEIAVGLVKEGYDYNTGDQVTDKA